MNENNKLNDNKTFTYNDLLKKLGNLSINQDDIIKEFHDNKKQEESHFQTITDKIEMVIQESEIKKQIHRVNDIKIIIDKREIGKDINETIKKTYSANIVNRKVPFVNKPYKYIFEHLTSIVEFFSLYQNAKNDKDLERRIEAEIILALSKEKYKDVIKKFDIIETDIFSSNINTTELKKIFNTLHINYDSDSNDVVNEIIHNTINVINKLTENNESLIKVVPVVPPPQGNKNADTNSSSNSSSSSSSNPPVAVPIGENVKDDYYIFMEKLLEYLELLEKIVNANTKKADQLENYIKYQIELYLKQKYFEDIIKYIDNTHHDSIEKLVNDFTIIQNKIINLLDSIQSFGVNISIDKFVTNMEKIKNFINMYLKLKFYDRNRINEVVGPVIFPNHDPRSKINPVYIIPDAQPIISKIVTDDALQKLVHDTEDYLRTIIAKQDESKSQLEEIHQDIMNSISKERDKAIEKYFDIQKGSTDEKMKKIEEKLTELKTMILESEQKEKKKDKPINIKNEIKREIRRRLKTDKILSTQSNNNKIIHTITNTIEKSGLTEEDKTFLKTLINEKSSENVVDTRFLTDLKDFVKVYQNERETITKKRQEELKQQEEELKRQQQQGQQQQQQQGQQQQQQGQQQPVVINNYITTPAAPAAQPINITNNNSPTISSGEITNSPTISSGEITNSQGETTNNNNNNNNDDKSGNGTSDNNEKGNEKEKEEEEDEEEDEYQTFKLFDTFTRIKPPSKNNENETPKPVENVKESVKDMNQSGATFVIKSGVPLNDEEENKNYTTTVVQYPFPEEKYQITTNHLNRETGEKLVSAKDAENKEEEEDD